MDLPLILEISALELRQSTERGFGKERATKAGLTIRSPRYSILEAGDNRNLLCECQAVNNRSGSKYKSSVLFESVDIVDDGSGTELQTANGPVNIAPVPGRSDVKVRCTCLDYRFRFADINDGENALLGNRPPPYVRKTDTRPPANPSNSPGMCKHLHTFMDYLESEGIIV